MSDTVSRENGHSRGNFAGWDRRIAWEVEFSPDTCRMNSMDRGEVVNLDLNQG